MWACERIGLNFSVQIPTITELCCQKYEKHGEVPVPGSRGIFIDFRDVTVSWIVRIELFMSQIFGPYLSHIVDRNQCVSWHGRLNALSVIAVQDFTTLSVPWAARTRHNAVQSMCAALTVQLLIRKAILWPWSEFMINSRYWFKSCRGSDVLTCILCFKQL